MMDLLQAHLDSAYENGFRSGVSWATSVVSLALIDVAREGKHLSTLQLQDRIGQEIDRRLKSLFERGLVGANMTTSKEGE